MSLAGCWPDSTAPTRALHAKAKAAVSEVERRQAIADLFDIAKRGSSLPSTYAISELGKLPLNEVELLQLTDLLGSPHRVIRREAALAICDLSPESKAVDDRVVTAFAAASPTEDVSCFLAEAIGLMEIDPAQTIPLLEEKRRKSREPFTSFYDKALARLRLADQ